MDALLLSGIRPQLSLVRGFVIVTESFVRNIRVCCLHLQNRCRGGGGRGVGISTISKKSVPLTSSSDNLGQLSSLEILQGF